MLQRVHEKSPAESGVKQPAVSYSSHSTVVLVKGSVKYAQCSVMSFK